MPTVTPLDPPAVRLVRPAAAARVAWQPDADAESAIAHTAGVLRLLGGPGSGKTATVARAAAARLNSGVRADQVLVLAFSRRAAAGLRDAVVAETTVALREVPVRSFESYAWAVLDRARRRHADWSAPRLITGPEQDAIIRELLAGALEGEGSTRWPDELRAALGTRGFAAEVRDAVMRCAQRGISAAQLAEWSVVHDRPVWASLAGFLTEYSGVTGMRLPDSYDPAELVRAVVDLWRREPAELLLEHRRVRHLYVDEAEELDPAKLELVSLLAGGVDSLVLSGDPGQSVFGFRGADRRGLMDFPAAHTATLRRQYRATPAMARVLQVVAAGTGAEYPDSLAVADDGLEPLVALCAASPGREAADVASVLRERHLVDGVPWSEMAVLVRSVSSALPVIRRAFVAAGVPVDPGIDEPAVGRSAAVRSLVELVLMSGDEHPDAARIEELLRSPYFRLDALQVRRMRKSLREHDARDGAARTSSALLREAVAGRLAVPPGTATAQLRELARILQVLRRLSADGATGEELLHAAWRESGAQQRWRAEALLGGSRGADADQRLDSVIAAFDIAASLSSRLREASFETIAAELERQELPADRLSRGVRRAETVQVLSASNAKGRQWEIVAVMGVQDGAWPNLVPRNTILGTEELSDLAVGVDPHLLDRRAQLMQEERRLFYLALSRARRQVVLSAVDGTGERPSRFFTSLCESVGVEPGRHRAERAVDRNLSMLDHVSQMRAVVLDSQAPDADRTVAVAALQRLAAAGVEGAAPDDWYALREMSSSEPVQGAEATVRISPSAATRFVQCPLQWFLGSVGERRADIHASVGTLVHKAFESVQDVGGRTHAELFNRMIAVVDETWDDLELDSPWENRDWRARVTAMVDRLAEWLAARGTDRQWVANEQSFDVTIGRARIRGAVDRLERDPATGGLYTVDLKTGSQIQQAEVPAHPQLGLYQLAAEAGAFGAPARSLGAELLFVKERRKEMVQPPLDESADPQWASELLDELVDGMSGSSFSAHPGNHCRRCDFVALCPAIREVGEEE